VKKLLVLLPLLPVVAMSTACSFSNTQLQDSHLSVIAHSSASSVVNDSGTSADNSSGKMDRTALIHTAMSSIESPTASTTTRQQLRADPQWNALANEVIYCVQELSANIVNLKQRSLYLAKLENPSSELKAFRSMVMTKLVQNGFSVTFAAKNAHFLKYDIVNTDATENLVIRVAVINGEKVMTKSRELAQLVNLEKRKEILRVVKHQNF